MTTTLAHGWMAWKNDAPHSYTLAETKESILIGYDMMSLRGLDVCEVFLQSRGVFISPTVVQVVAETEMHCYAPTIMGHIVPDSLRFSCCASDAEQSRINTAGWITHQVERDRIHNRVPFFVLTRDEYRSLSVYFMYMRDRDNIMEPEDKRRISTYRTKRDKALAILDRYGIAIVPIRFTRETDVSQEATA